MIDEVTFETFLPHVTQHLPSVPEIVAVHAIRNAAIELCTRSHIWEVEHDPITVVSGVNNYEFDPPCDATVIHVRLAWFEGTPIHARSEDELQAMFGSDWRTQGGKPRAYTQFNTYEVVLVPCPDARSVSGLKMTVALAPTQASTTIDSAIYERWAEKIAYGARARLHETPNQTYFDPVAALKFRALFAQGISQAKVERNRSLTRADQRVRFPRFI